MNIHEFCERFALTHKKARDMEKAGVIKFDESDGRAARIRQWLSKGQRLTSAHLCDLVESPKLIDDLGKYADLAHGAVQSLGNVKDEIAPKHVTAYVADAASGDADALSIIVAWLKTIIPDKGVGHRYIAVRLLLGIPYNVREFDYPRMQKLFLNCRRHDDFAGWWKKVNAGKRNSIIYEKPLDL